MTLFQEYWIWFFEKRSSHTISTITNVFDTADRASLKEDRKSLPLIRTPFDSRLCLSCGLSTVTYRSSPSPFPFVSTTILNACSYQGSAGGERLWMTQVMGNLGQQVMLSHPLMNFSSMGLYLWNSSPGQGSIYRCADRIAIRD